MKDTYFTFPRLAVSANSATTCLQVFRSLACFSASSHVIFIFSSSSSTLFLQVVLGLPLLRLPGGFHLKHFLGFLDMFILRTCPSHLSLLILICVSKSFSFVLKCRSVLEILFGQKTRHISLRQLLWKELSLFISFLITLQHSEP